MTKSRDGMRSAGVGARRLRGRAGSLRGPRPVGSGVPSPAPVGSGSYPASLVPCCRWTPTTWTVSTPAKRTVDRIHANGSKAICYISVGSWENWRPDKNRFPESVLGNDYDGWPGERWLDIRKLDVLGPIMGDRMDMCRDKGFDAVEPDNMDGYTNRTGFELTAKDQLRYNQVARAGGPRAGSIHRPQERRGPGEGPPTPLRLRDRRGLLRRGLVPAVEPLRPEGQGRARRRIHRHGRDDGALLPAGAASYDSTPS